MVDHGFLPLLNRTNGRSSPWSWVRLRNQSRRPHHPQRMRVMALLGWLGRRSWCQPAKVDLEVAVVAGQSVAAVSDGVGGWDELAVWAADVDAEPLGSAAESGEESAHGAPWLVGVVSGGRVVEVVVDTGAEVWVVVGLGPPLPGGVVEVDDLVLGVG